MKFCLLIVIGKSKTNVSRELLFYWEHPEIARRLCFVQLDAVRTLIYLNGGALWDGSAADILKSLLGMQ